MTGTQLARMLKIHHQIQAGRFPNVPSLSRFIGKGKRAIERDLRYMRNDLKLPIDYCPLHRGYFYTEEVLHFPTQLVTESDLHLIAVLEASVAQFPACELKSRMQNLLKEFTKGLPNRLKEKRTNWRNLVSIRTPNRAKLNPQHLDFLAQAAATNSQVGLGYRKPNQPGHEHRILDPLHLFWMSGDWYVLAREVKTGLVKRFSLLRMKDLTLTGVKFERPADFDPEFYLGNSFGLQSADGDYEVILRIKPHLADYIHEREWNGMTKLVSLPGGGVELHLRLSSLVEIKRWLTQWDGGIRVMQPAKLRKMVADSSMATYCANQEEEADVTEVK